MAADAPQAEAKSTLKSSHGAPSTVNESIANACNHGHVHSASASDMSKTSVTPRAIIIANDHMNLEKTCQSHGLNVICCTSFAPRRSLKFFILLPIL